MAIFSAISYAVGYAVGFLGAAAGITMTGAALTVATAIANIGTALVMNAVARSLAPKVNVPQTEVQAVINQTDAPRRVYVGQNLAGGIRAFFDVKGGALYQLVMVSHGQVSEFVRFWIDGEPTDLDAEGDVISGPKNGYINVGTRDGRALGGNYGRLSQFSTWNATRRLEGQATFLVVSWAPKAEKFMKVFPKAYNTVFQWVIRGQEVYDPRTNRRAYSDNAALIIAHYLTHPDGYRLDPAEINWASVAAMADVADLRVARKDGTTSPNLRLWGYWTLDEEPAQVLDRMHTSGGIRPYEMQDGRIGLIGGPLGEPACTLTAKDIREIQTSEAISEREGYNVLRVFHLSAKQKYEVIEVDEWRDEARLAQEGEIAQEYRLEMCPDLAQARRLAKRQMHDDNRAKVSIVTNLVGLKARWPRHNGQRHTILLDYRPEDGSGRVIQGEYEVLDHEFDPVGLECRIELGRVNRASEAWTSDEEGETTADLPDAEQDLAPPISAVLSQRVIQVSAGTRQAILEIEAIPVEDREDLTIEAQYRRVGNASWSEMVRTDLKAQSGAVEDGAQYEAQVRWRGVFDGVAPWVPLGPITVQIDGTAPGVPSELIPSPSGTGVHLSWRNPSSGFFEIRVYRSVTNNVNAAALIGTTGGASGQLSEYSDPVGPGTYFYWVRAANVSGVEGPAAGPAQITKT